MKYFCYCPESGFNTFKTAEEAKSLAEQSIDYFRDRADEGWSYEVDQVCWGEIKETTTKCDERTVNEARAEGIVVSSACDSVCDYKLLPVTK